MTHQDLADNFCSFVYDFIQEADNISFINKTDEMFYRVCFQKLYYALYHKMLHHDTGLSESNSPGKHETIYQKLVANDPSLAQLCLKMRSLRLWADYKLENTPQSPPNITFYQNQVYKVVKRSTINI